MSDRKYRHKGYQDSGSSSSGSGPRGPQAPREYIKPRLEGAPRGRSAGGFGPDAFKCSHCSEVQRMLDEVTAESKCGKCSADLHTCWNCRHFDTSTRWECKEAIPARVTPKDKANTCASFAPKIIRDLAPDKGRIESADDARKAFDALFKK